MNINSQNTIKLEPAKKGLYTVQSGKQANTTLEVDIIAESKRYYWIKIFNSIQRKKKGKVKLIK